MKTDQEVKLMRQERLRGKRQDQAAARSGMSVRTLRKYERSGDLPSQLKKAHTWRTRPDSFTEDWPWVVLELSRDPALQAKTLFGLLLERSPGRYEPSQLRTLQRRISAWRCQQGPEREVMFEQVHEPGEAIQSDFTRMADLGVTLFGQAFVHMVFHAVLTYSNVESVTICFSESFEALAEGLERALASFGGVPIMHRTDNLSAAIRDLGKDKKREFTQAYQALIGHYGMVGSSNHPGVSHQNGDVESSHNQFKRSVDQALRVRGHRDFADRNAYENFLGELVRRRNATRATRFANEQQHLRPLPPAPLLPCKELLVKVNRFSIIRVQGNAYSVPSRLIGSGLRVRIRLEVLELYHGSVRILILPRLIGRHRQRIDYRHVIWSLMRKPGAFMAYKYREEMFPCLIFRQAFDALHSAVPARAVREYLHMLFAAATISESEVVNALTEALAAGEVPTAEVWRARMRSLRQEAPQLTPLPVINLGVYDSLIAEVAHG
jgi:transposase